MIPGRPHRRPQSKTQAQPNVARTYYETFFGIYQEPPHQTHSQSNGATICAYTSSTQSSPRLTLRIPTILAKTPQVVLIHPRKTQRCIRSQLLPGNYNTLDIETPITPAGKQKPGTIALSSHHTHNTTPTTLQVEHGGGPGDRRQGKR
jgi:hypothetical protein